MALAEIDRVIAAGVRFGCVLADASYGMSAPFRQGLTARRWAPGRSLEEFALAPLPDAWRDCICGSEASFPQSRIMRYARHGYSGYGNLDVLRSGLQLGKLPRQAFRSWSAARWSRCWLSGQRAVAEARGPI
jgi:hypothetical protein